jgi:hypothetical protein
MCHFLYSCGRLLAAATIANRQHDVAFDCSWLFTLRNQSKHASSRWSLGVRRISDEVDVPPLPPPPQPITLEMALQETLPVPRVLHTLAAPAATYPPLQVHACRSGLSHPGQGSGQSFRLKHDSACRVRTSHCVCFRLLSDRPQFRPLPPPPELPKAHLLPVQEPAALHRGTWPLSDNQPTTFHPTHKIHPHL